MKAISQRLRRLSFVIALTSLLHPAAVAQSALIEDDAADWSYSSTEFTKAEAIDASGGSVHVGWRSGDYAMITFTGIQVQVFGTKFPQGKTGDFYIDDLNGQPETASWSYPRRLPQQLIWTSPVLPSGQHILELVAQGDWIELDFIRVLTAADSAPSAPTNLTAKPEIGEVQLTWNPVLEATSYEVKRSSVAGGTYESVGTVTETAFTDPNLPDGTRFYYVVEALNPSGTGPTSLEVSATPGLQPPPAPLGLSTTTGNRQVMMDWDVALGADTYNVKRATKPGGPYTILTTGLVEREYTDKAVTNGVTYYYVVSALNPAGEGLNSGEVQATPTGDQIVQDNDASLQYSSTDFSRDNNPKASGGTQHIGWRKGNAVTYTFTGRQIEVYGKKFSRGQTADIYIDDLSTPAATGVSWKADKDQFQSLIWASSPLPLGEHTIKLVVGGDWIEFDYFRVLTVVQPGPLAIKKEADKVVISWPPGGVLQSVGQVNGVWQDVPGAGAGPYVVAPQGVAIFFRLRP